MAKKQIFDINAYAKTARQAVSEGAVLLRNEGRVLPLAAGAKVALFGRIQYDYYKSGTGSGGLVNTSYVVGIREAMEQGGFQLNEKVHAAYQSWLKDHPFNKGEGWGREPWSQEEMPLDEALVKEAAKESETAVIIIGRSAGEDHDSSASEGSYLLTGLEEQMMDVVCRNFEKTVVLLNVGNIIDMKWVEKYQPSAVLYVWQGGQEGGNGVLDILNGTVSPSGRLADTIAMDIEDYPSTKNFGSETENIYAEDIYVGYRYFETFAKDKVVFPFGFGLSYTDFELQAQASDENGDVTLQVKVSNIGKMPGKEAVLAFVEAPQGKLGKPSRMLAGFAKTKELSPGEEEQLTIFVPQAAFASYDDSGITGHKSCYVLEAGDYRFYIGEDVRSAKLAGTVQIPELKVVEELEEVMAPVKPFQRMKPTSFDGTITLSYEDAPQRTMDPMQRRKERLPKEAPYKGNQGYQLADVADGKVSMEDFLAQLSEEELACLTRGEGMNSPKAAPGTGGAFGGVTEALREYGIPIGCCTDGPSGIRLDCGNLAFSLPNGACLASTFNEALCEELFQWTGMELRKNEVDCLLGPGMNIHRNPLNGRNFEYFSEDPFVSGKTAAAILRGMQTYDVTGTIKHFAANNQESNRFTVNGVISERALREIYLKGFEIAVKEGDASAVMTTYGPINGIWTASNYDLVTTVLRGEWGFEGIVMSDWWAMGNDEGSAGDRSNAAQMVRAQNDLYMVTQDSLTNTNHDNILEWLSDGKLTRAELVRCAGNICRWLLAKPAFLRMQGKMTELDRQLQDYVMPEMGMEDGRFYVVGESGEIPPQEVALGDGDITWMTLQFQHAGEYQIRLTLRSVLDLDMAQLPLSIFKDGKLVEMVNLRGGERDWLTKTIRLGTAQEGNSHIKIFCRQSGLAIKEFVIEKI